MMRRPPRFRARISIAADGDVGLLLDMLLEHALVIHLVDVVSGQQHDEFGFVRLDDVDVLVHGVGRAEIPVGLRDALAGGQDIETLVPLRAEESFQPICRCRIRLWGLVLGCHRDPRMPEFTALERAKSMYARFSAEINRRLGAPAVSSRSGSRARSCKNEGEGVA